MHIPARTDWLCPPALLADPFHAQALVGFPTSLPREMFLQRGILCCSLLGIILSRMCTDLCVWVSPFSLFCSLVAGGGTPEEWVVCSTVGIPAATWALDTGSLSPRHVCYSCSVDLNKWERALSSPCARFLPQSSHQPCTMGITWSQYHMVLKCGFCFSASCVLLKKTTTVTSKGDRESLLCSHICWPGNMDLGQIPCSNVATVWCSFYCNRTKEVIN